MAVYLWEFLEIGYSKMNTICVEDGIDDKCTHEQNSSEHTDKTDDQNINKQTVSIRIHTSSWYEDYNTFGMQDQNSKTLKANDQIQYKLNNSNEWIKATVLGRAGKVTSKNKNWYNVLETESEKQKSVDLGQLQWKTIEKNHDLKMLIKS